MRAVAFIAATLLPLTIAAQEVALKSGESADFLGVYWVGNCRSLLKNFVGVDVFGGPKELKASLREQPIVPRRQGCANPVPGAMIVLSAMDVNEPYEGTVRIRVQYNTEDGVKMSTHPFKLLLVPASK